MNEKLSDKIEALSQVMYESALYALKIESQKEMNK